MITATALLLFFGCHRERDQLMHVRLQLCDSLLEEHPHAILDSLATINVKKLSRANRAYYGLLKTIADDKTYHEFTSDSLINRVHSYYHRYDAQHDNHIRALVYQAIVRYRMQMPDSVIFVPLKEAERLYAGKRQSNPHIGYLLHYYIGTILSGTGNSVPAENYFHKALQLAKQENDSMHIFDAYLVLFWNEMENEEYGFALNLLDSLTLYVGSNPNNTYYLLNAQSVYYKNNDKIDMAIESKKEQIKLIPQIKEKTDLFKVYYSLSDAYLKNNQSDTALYYGLQAIHHIEDSTYKLNYLLYENVADIAEAQQNLAMALEYRKKAFEVYEGSVDNRLDTQIWELEKKYSVAESENNALKAQRRSRVWFMALLTMMLLLILLALYTSKQRAITRLKQRETAERALRLQAEKLQMEGEAERLQKMVGISAQFLGRHAVLQEKARKMVNKIRARENKLGEEYEQMLKEGQAHFNSLAESLFTVEELQELFGIRQDLELFTESDRLFLIMLAADAPTAQIAAMLNTTPHNLKTRKSYLKAKIEKNATEQNNFTQLLTLFAPKNRVK